MCLDIMEENKRYVEYDDIVCYKILREKFTDYFESEYHNFHYVVGETYKLGKPLAYKPSLSSCFLGEVSEGFHSFAKLQDAKDYLTILPHFDILPRYVLARCVIPKGGMYYEGAYFFGSICYASDMIRIEEIYR